jgi:tRNA(Ile)-lysidine synthase
MTAAPQPTVAVAFSGGCDSLALLHATCCSARVLGLGVVAIHVHHGLLPEADGWLARALALCARWRRRGLPLTLRWARLEGQPAPGDSLEAWARAGRHAALARLAAEAGATLLLLAQHRRDQAETVLLQALRGGGPAGLSAMPLSASRDGLVWARPWLEAPREAIEAYARRHRLRPVDDPSNADLRLARGRLRQQVWPALLAAFPDAEAALALVARRAQEARAALDELGALDLVGCVDAQGRLSVAAWRQLSVARQANTLRAWWVTQAGRGATESLVQRLLAEVPVCGAAHWPAGQGWTVALGRGHLHAMAPPVLSTSSEDQSAGARIAVLDLSHPGRWPAAGWGGLFLVRTCAHGGISPGRLQAVALRPRAGGERFQRQPRSLPRSLKLQFQASGVPASLRGGPLLWSANGDLLFVPGLGPDARCQAPAGEPQLALQWIPDGPPPGPDRPAG